MTETQKEIINILQGVERDGMTEMIEFLVNSDFFTAPASTKGHANYSGGLADHSLNVYEILTMLNKEFADPIYNGDSIAVVGLLHDLCKVDTYVEDEDPATSAQIKYLNDLLDKQSEVPPPSKEFMTKGYVTKLIDYLKNGGNEVPAFSKSWKVVEELPMGHGEKSIYIINRFMDLTDDEALAIRWHLGSFDPGVHFFYPSGIANQKAVEKAPLVSLTVCADYLATWQIDVKM